ncbi:MAG: tRNA (N6-isopentenyl adenosine(37)-C2)-methylthiotransferase MiaB [Candidatus Saccharicenans sp.]|nr:MAG: tRNA (N6-isopentenyl adenosine(37)-C2)-methylthiotransferase MiaB [Candidatus Aminicenantes bacterium]HEK85967.1 tRNA (N6-isopentenyl adenosine(37)-C2)-methylthiotransferase MiaB [Candidatus Aminicenantes bacterium]
MLKGKRFYLHTFGCQMNVNDSEHVASLLLKEGAVPAVSPDKSDLIIINTCAVREKSVKKLFSYLGRLKQQKERQGTLIVCLGCVAQLYREKLLKKFPYLDLVVGPPQYQSLPAALKALELEQQKKILTGWERRWVELPIKDEARESQVSAYVTIMEGCNNFCSYCVVPFTRGRERYRPMSSILTEVKDLATAGYLEIQLLGQNVNSYQDPETGHRLPELLKRISEVEGLEWIRFLTSHPKDFTLELAEAMATYPKICHQLHLPLQSGSNRILKKMNRGYTREEYLDKINLLKSRLPDISLSTDLIVGFPTETEDDFQQTLELVEKIQFTNIFSFRYSPRPLTAAAKMKDDVPEEVKIDRLIRLQSRQKEIQTALHRKLVGKTVRVLCLGRSKRGNLFCGRNEGYQVVNFSSNTDVAGKMIQVKITGSGPYSLQGEAVI